jgi:hypothetical protein
VDLLDTAAVRGRLGRTVIVVSGVSVVDIAITGSIGPKEGVKP